MADPKSWRHDRSVNLHTLLAIALVGVSVLAYALRLSGRVDIHERAISRVEQRQDEARALALRVERIDECMRAVLQAVQEVKGELRRVRERGE